MASIGTGNPASLLALVDPGVVDHAHRLWRSALPAWAMDCLELRRRGLDRPTFHAGEPIEWDADDDERHFKAAA